jgi:hypothetical protein
MCCWDIMQLEFYTAFKAKHPDVNCGLTSFKLLKPWWVKWLRLWNTCCCRYHQKLTKLMIALDMMRMDKHEVHSNCPCDCDIVCGGLGCKGDSRVCNSHRQVFVQLTNLWSSILCPKPELSLWHRRECLMGTCPDCGLQLLRICPLELISEKLVKWKSIEYKIIGTT